MDGMASVTICSPVTRFPTTVQAGAEPSMISSDGYRRRSSHSATSSPTPPTNCARRSPASEPSCRSHSPTQSGRRAEPAIDLRRRVAARRPTATTDRRAPHAATSERGVERWEPFDLGEVAKSIVLSHQQEAERQGIHIDAVLTEATATGDRSLVASLLTNLVDNALRHNQPEVVLRSRLRQEQDERTSR
jgi:hypothetical protein